MDFVLWFWYWGSHLLDRFFAYIGRRVTHKLISTKYLCFYWKAHILLSSQKIMLCMICNIDILNKDLHVFYIKKQRRFLSTRSSQLQHISHDFWKTLQKFASSLSWSFLHENFFGFFLIPSCIKGNNFRNHEIYFVVLWRYLRCMLHTLVLNILRQQRCNKLFCSS